MIRRYLPLDYCGAVIVAAGNATRMCGIDKTTALLRGEPVIVHTVRAFQDCDAIKEIVVVTRSDLLMQVSELCHGFSKVRAVVVGGDNRVASVQNGLSALSAKARLVAVQDGARPLVSFAVIDRTVRAAHSYGAAAPGVPVKDTIKCVAGGLIASTPERKSLQAVQTPQVFDTDILRGALRKAVKDGAEITDDCSAVERLGLRIRMVEGDEQNIKITTPTDLKLAEMLLEDQK
ncbi:MAG: 2-C-methyl-D-erythritol 4-phosphate cytidylyltransferase [Ruminococcaceae bacterium]|nr:2-C-methyl-D-erythritol 4-phosphate cytidylyltransferase [Oscillospiraceae bacterium]